MITMHLWTLLIVSISSFRNIVKLNSKRVLHNCIFKLSSSEDSTMDESDNFDHQQAVNAPKVIEEDVDSDDPLRGAAILEKYNFENSVNNNIFLATANIESQDMLNLRKEAWLHHCQWIRRLTIAPQTPVSILFEYTRLSKDFMFPVGQVVGFKSESFTNVEDIIKTEPLFMNGGLSKWQIYKMITLKSRHAKLDIYEPYVFIGIYNKPDISMQESQVDYHLSSNKTCIYGILRDVAADGVSKIKKIPLYDDGFVDEPLDNTNLDESMYNFDGSEIGICLVFNSKSNAEALQYISNDPVFKDNRYTTKVWYPFYLELIFFIISFIHSFEYILGVPVLVAY